MPQDMRTPGLLETEAQPMPDDPMLDEPMVDEPGEGGQLTVTAEAIASEAMGELPEPAQDAVRKFVDAGMHVLFKDGEAHHNIFSSIEANPEVPVADLIGTGAVGLITQMWNEAGENADGTALGVAATILLAKVYEFLDQTGTPVSDEDFVTSMELMFTKLADADPEFRGALGLPGEEPPMEQGAPMPGQEAQPGGLLQAPPAGGPRPQAGTPGLLPY